MKHTAKRFAALLAALVLALCLSIPAFAAAPLVRDEMPKPPATATTATYIFW